MNAGIVVVILRLLLLLTGNVRAKWRFFKPFQVSFFPSPPFCRFYGLAVVSGGEGVQRKVDARKAARFFLPEFPGMCSLLKEKGDELV